MLTVKYFLPAAIVIGIATTAMAADPELPAVDAVEAVKLFEVPEYCEGVVFDAKGKGYISWGKTITWFTVDGEHGEWAQTGSPNGHKILANGNHLVCDASAGHLAVLTLSPEGKLLDPASKEVDGAPLFGPNDLTLDTANGGFYFSDPGTSTQAKPTGAVHYVDKKGVTHLVASKLAYPNGIVLTPDGKKLLVAESQQNRVLEYPVKSPGVVGPMRVFADLPKNPSGKIDDNQPDGMCLDAAGNLYVAHYGMNAVQVLSPEGKMLRTYATGNQLTSNVAFGGPKHDQLFVTGAINADGKPGAVMRLDLGVKGLVILPK
jgi:gluconolactonase